MVRVVGAGQANCCRILVWQILRRARTFTFDSYTVQVHLGCISMISFLLLCTGKAGCIMGLSTNSTVPRTFSQEQIQVVNSSNPRRVQDSAQLEKEQYYFRIKVKDKNNIMHTFPAGNSLVPQSDLMLPSPTIMIDECISEDLSRDAIRMHHPNRGGFQ